MSEEIKPESLTNVVEGVLSGGAIDTKALHNVIDGILSGAEQEADESHYMEAYHKTIALYKETSINLNEASTFDCLIQFPQRMALDNLIQGLLPGKSSWYRMVWQNYQQSDTALSNIFEKLEGGACCADKSGFVINYTMQILDGMEPKEWDRSKFYVPKFGAEEDWVQVVKALSYLDVDKLILSYGKIMAGIGAGRNHAPE